MTIPLFIHRTKQISIFRSVSWERTKIQSWIVIPFSFKNATRNFRLKFEIYTNSPRKFPPPPFHLPFHISIDRFGRKENKKLAYYPSSPPLPPSSRLESKSHHGRKGVVENSRKRSRLSLLIWYIYVTRYRLCTNREGERGGGGEVNHRLHLLGCNMGDGFLVKPWMSNLPLRCLRVTRKIA